MDWSTILCDPWTWVGLYVFTCIAAIPILRSCSKDDEVKKEGERELLYSLAIVFTLLGPLTVTIWLLYWVAWRGVLMGVAEMILPEEVHFKNKDPNSPF